MRVIGNGSFGVVYQAKVPETDEVVAIKKVYQDRRYKNRELQIMKELHHPNIVKLLHAFFTQGDKSRPSSSAAANGDELYLNVVMEYLPDTVHRVMKHHAKAKQKLSILYVKSYAYQLCRSLAYLHAVGICHRDIKPQNLLVDAKSNVLKLCDFGSGKRLSSGEPNVSYICSRFYRAPELIFGATLYSTAIDTWSIGCVIAEMVIGSPLFPGDSGVDQLVEIIKILGTPSKAELRSMNANYADFRFPAIQPVGWGALMKDRAGPEVVELISSMLQYDPLQRLTPADSLAHPFFDELRVEGAKLPTGRPIPNLFNFSKEELAAVSPSKRKALVPDWFMARPEGQKLVEEMGGLLE